MKYNAKRTVVDGITFDSKKEAEYYEELCLRTRANDIKDFEIQPKFTLQPAFTKNGKKYQPIRYHADFLIHHNNDTWEVIDVKGYKKNPVYLLKKKMFECRYPHLTITEV